MSRLPPAAAWPVRPDPWAQGAAAGLWGGGTGALALALAQRSETPAAITALVAIAAASVAAVLAWRRARQRDGQLAWTGAAWTWRGQDAAELALLPPQVMLDLDGWLLVRCAPGHGGARRWMSLRRDALPADVDGAAWAAFRAAVYSPASRTDDRPDARDGSSP